ncbi:MAG: RDD family protein [Ignavibacteriae bacterium]|nr:RDD family protein [Ignavibacteriota bacterium]
MDSAKYSNLSIEELYDLYAKFDHEQFPQEGKLIYKQMLLTEKANKYFTESNNLALRSQRFFAALIDILVTLVPINLILFFTFHINDIIIAQLEYGYYFAFGMLLIIQITFFMMNGWLLYKYGQTIGKAILKIKIIDQNKKLPDLMTSYVIRYLFISIMPLIPLFGILIMMIDFILIFQKDRKCIHDHLAGTTVIKMA